VITVNISGGDKIFLRIIRNQKYKNSHLEKKNKKERKKGINIISGFIIFVSQSDSLTLFAFD